MNLKKKIDKDFILDTAVKLLEYDSPSGYCKGIIDDIIIPMSKEMGLDITKNEKGNAIIHLKGKSDKKVVAYCAHVDTLGAMVRSITNRGTLKFTVIGAPIIPSLDSEYCRIRTRDGKVYTGTFLSESAAIHVYPDATNRARDEKNMEVRIDENVKTKEDVEKLGISPGDYICFDTKTQITKSGFLKSRFIDDKACVAILFGFIKAINDYKLALEYDTKLIFSTYEEVGHGSSSIPSDITELIAVDMGCVGDDLSCTEYDVSICAKDSSGPYDYDMITKLKSLSKENDIPHVIDIYPRYSSDVTAALRGGNNIRGGLIGPGVHASHGMERTHYEAIEATVKLMLAYSLEQ